MSTINKWLTGVIAALFLALAGSLLYVRIQATEIGANRKVLEQTQKELVDAQASLQKQSNLAKATDRIVTQTVVKTLDTKDKVEKINSGVDIITKKVKNEEISTTAADLAYSNSMWETYCQVKPSDSNCSSRHPSN